MGSSGSYDSSPGRRNAGIELIQELDALRQSLYMSQQPLAPSRTGSLSLPNAKKLQTREDSHGVVDEAIPIPGLVNAGHNSMVSTASRNLRHSIAHPQRAESNVMTGVRAARFSASATSGISSEKVDIRGRRNRHSVSPFRMLKGEELNRADDSLNIVRAHDEENLDFKRMEHKKLGFWTWKPIRALSHIGMERFSCVFSVYVNAIHGLSPSVNGFRLTVSLRKKESRDGAVQTMPALVFQGVAEFDETLHIKCHVYGSSSRNGNSQGFMKFQPRPFTISVVAVEEKELNFSKHHVDLSMLIQESVQKQSSGKDCGGGWNASFPLCGKGSGAELVVGLGYEILDKDARLQIGSCRFKEYSYQLDKAPGRISKSLPSSSRGTPKMIGANGFPSAYESVDSPFQSQMGGNYTHDFIPIDDLNIDDARSPQPAQLSQTIQRLNKKCTPNGISARARGSEDPW